jgi:transposase-like protein
MSPPRKKISAQMKAKIALEAMSGLHTLTEIAEKYGIHPITIGKWKKQMEENAADVFRSKEDNKELKEKDRIIETLYKKVGQREIELDWLKKKVGLEP